MREMISLWAILAAVVCTSISFAAVRGEALEYRDGEVALEGYLAYDDAAKGKRPGVLIIHDWSGVGPYVKRRAEQLAGLGYVAFAADIYGKGVRPQNSAESAKTASIYRSDRPLLRKRANAGLEALRRQELVDAKRIAAIGYCFGGMAALELARSGADIAGVVSFHGGLETPHPEDAKNIRAKVLVLHGADDPNVPPAQVAAFQDEMRKAGVDYQINIYGGAVHAFTVPTAGNDPSRGAAYNEKADHRSWEAMRILFDEIFGSAK